MMNEIPNRSDIMRVLFRGCEVKEMLNFGSGITSKWRFLHSQVAPDK